MSDPISALIAAQADPFREGGPLHHASWMCQELGVPLPPLPGPLLPLLEQRGDTTFTTRADVTTLDAFDEHLAEVLDGTAPTWAGLAHEGHGANAWFFRYVVVLPRLAVFLEIPLGGAYDELDVAQGEVRQAVEGVEALLAKAYAAPAGPRFVVEIRRVRTKRWCEVEPGKAPAWVDVADPIGAVLAAL